MAAAPLRRRAPVRQPAPAHPAPVRRRPPVRRPAPARGLARPAGAAVLDRLLSGRLWIGLVFLLLVGIVFFNVDLLGMNRDIARTAERSETIKRENARLRGDIARLGSSERIQKVAADSGLVLPAAGEVRYLKPNAGADARNALARLKSAPATGTPAEIPPAQTGHSEAPGSTHAVPQAEPQAPVAQAPVATQTPPATQTPTATETPAATQIPATQVAPTAQAPVAPQAGQ